jgi:hypothetical protein
MLPRTVIASLVFQNVALFSEFQGEARLRTALLSDTMMDHGNVDILTSCGTPPPAPPPSLLPALLNYMYECYIRDYVHGLHFH